MKKGLELTPRTTKEASVIKKALEAIYYVTWNASDGSFFLPEDEENYDELEKEIDNILSSLNVNYRIEGIFY